MNEEIYSREQNRLALMFNVFMKASFVPGRLIVNKSKPARFALAGFSHYRHPTSYPARKPLKIWEG
jgi:hypothetical protein